jgi:hypothetical protein
MGGVDGSSNEFLPGGVTCGLIERDDAPE